MRGGDNQDDCCEDDDRGNDRAQRDGFAGNEPAKKKRHDGIHERVGGHACGCALLQNVNVRTEADA